MSKSVMLSVRPERCEKICCGEKTIEVRKTRPKLQTPFKCYIYCNCKTVRHGITFDSKHEADRYDELQLLLKAGEIHDLKLQQTYKLVGAQRTPTGAVVRAVTYIADFRVYPRRENDCRGRKGL